MGVSLLLLAALVFVPLVLVLLDLFAGLRARHRRVPGVDGRVMEDFDVLVPIYGSMRYLENVAYLAEYGERVILCTTINESDEFNRDINDVARRHGFRVFRARAGAVAQGGQRATSGTVRDRIIRDAHAMVRAPWVVCIDADTVTERPLGQLVGAMVTRGFDFVSVRLVPSNSDTLLARLQAHEYDIAMLLRRVMPWMVSGACHAARSDVHRTVMAKHSLFFQGNDIEVGLLADQLGYRVGHIPFDVPTTVPSTLRPWLRQRLAWAGGEVRLFVANPQIARRHPFFWIYGAMISIGGFPLRWYGLTHLSWSFLVVPALYICLLSYLQRRTWSPLILLMPLYAGFSSLILTPIGLYYYVKMASADRNWGLIRAGGRRQSSDLAGLPRQGNPMRHAAHNNPAARSRPVAG